MVIPAYNCGGLLAEAVQSVRAQTYRDFEVIVADDGSTDDTAEVAARLAASWPKMRLIRARHRGLAAARNRAIAEMSGQWIALLDADDLWLPDKLRQCMDFLEANPDLSIVYSPMDPIRMDASPMDGHSKPCHAGWLTEKLFHSTFVHDPAVVFHKRVVEACGGFDESLPVGVGHEFWLRVSTKFEFGLIDEPLALRRWHEGSLTRSDRVRAWQIRARLLERFYFEQGGRDLIPAHRAMRRLSKTRRKGGRVLLGAHRYEEAAQYLLQAIRLFPWHPEAYLYWVFANLAHVCT